MHESLIYSKAAEIHEGHKEVRNPYVNLVELEKYCRNDETLGELFDAMISDCKRYAETVFRFEQIVLESLDKGGSVTEERIEIDKVRSGIHDATIDSINILARTIRKQGGDSSWVSQLVSSGRAGYGKFALTTALEYAISSLEPLAV